MDLVGQATADLVAELSPEHSERLLDVVRGCMLAINALYQQVDLLKVQMETGMLDHSGECINRYQDQMESVFRSYARGEWVPRDEVQELAVSWMVFRDSQDQLMDYIEQHPDLEKD